MGVVFFQDIRGHWVRSVVRFLFLGIQHHQQHHQQHFTFPYFFSFVRFFPIFPLFISVQLSIFLHTFRLLFFTYPLALSPFSLDLPETKPSIPLTSLHHALQLRLRTFSADPGCCIRAYPQRHRHRKCRQRHHRRRDGQYAPQGRNGGHCNRRCTLRIDRPRPGLGKLPHALLCSNFCHTIHHDTCILCSSPAFTNHKFAMTGGSKRPGSRGSRRKDPSHRGRDRLPRNPACRPQGQTGRPESGDERPNRDKFESGERSSSLEGGRRCPEEGRGEPRECGERQGRHPATGRQRVQAESWKRV